MIKNDDERRRPISRAYMSTLTDRVYAWCSHFAISKDIEGTEAPSYNYGM